MAFKYRPPTFTFIWNPMIQTHFQGHQITVVLNPESMLESPRELLKNTHVYTPSGPRISKDGTRPPC